MTSHNIVPAKVFGRRYLGVGYGAVRMMRPPRSAWSWGKLTGWAILAIGVLIAGAAIVERLSQTP